MWCSNCGKTIRPEDDACQHCGASLGENRFYGSAYTSSQVRLPVEALKDAPEGGMISYTRTSYMSYDNQPEDDVYSNTTYRPLLSDEEDISLKEAEEEAARAAEEAARQAEEAAEAEDAHSEEEPAEAAPAGETDAAEEPAPDAEDAFAADEYEEPAEDIIEESTSPLPPLKKAAISPRVLSYMEEMERSQQKRAPKLRLPSFMKKSVPAPAEDEYEAAEGDAVLTEETEIQEPVYEEQAESTEEAADDSALSYEEETPAEDAGEASEYVADEETDDFSEYADEEEPIDEEYEDDEEDKLGLDFSAFKKFDFKALLQNRILKISVAAVLIVAVIAAGVVWLSFVSTKRPKIADVTSELYFKGIETLQQHIGEEYRADMTQAYMVNTSYANQTFSDNMKEFGSYLKEDAKPNDALFVAALTNIQDAIADAIIADANAQVNGAESQRAETSKRDWQAIENAVAKLSEAVTTGELTALVTDLNSIVAPTPTPTIKPTETVYQPLSNGMMDNVEVKKMQNRLVNLGFLDGIADGDFGNGTEEAVKAFQRAAGLTADGVASHETQKAMYAEDAPRNNASAEATDAPPVG